MYLKALAISKLYYVLLSWCILTKVLKSKWSPQKVAYEIYTKVSFISLNVFKSTLKLQLDFKEADNLKH